MTLSVNNFYVNIKVDVKVETKVILPETLKM